MRYRSTAAGSESLSNAGTTISSRHPELDGQLKRLCETIEAPDIVQAGDGGALLAARLYDKTPVTALKYLVVVYRETHSSDGFVVTAYFARELSSAKDTLWQRQDR